MNIEAGDQVKLVSIEEVNPDDPPGVDEDMELYFGSTVTVREISHNVGEFFIEEDEGDFKYSISWIDSKMKTSIPKNLKRMI